MIPSIFVAAVILIVEASAFGACESWEISRHHEKGRYERLQFGWHALTSRSTKPPYMAYPDWPWDSPIRRDREIHLSCLVWCLRLEVNFHSAYWGTRLSFTRWSYESIGWQLHDSNRNGWGILRGVKI